MGRSSEWVTAATVTVALAVVSVSTAISFYVCRKKAKVLKMKIEELESSIDCCLKKCAAERQGRIRAQKALREALAAQTKSGNLEETSYYPMTPIGFVHSCFSTRNGTPRQPLLVPLARAHLIFDRAQVPPASLEGLAGYSHCWILYVFHLNTDLEKLWKKPSRSKFKAKVRVPRLKGERIGVFATRSPHRPCPIGLTVAKVEAVQGNTVLLSGVDLVDGTPVLDIKPYLPYCDSIQEAAVPNWVTDDNLLAVASVSFSEGFSSSLAECWENVGKNSLYASPDELKCLIKQILLWDIRSVSQRNQPHDPTRGKDNASNGSVGPDGKLDEGVHAENVIYHLILEGVDVSYEIDNDGNVVVERATISSK